MFLRYVCLLLLAGCIALASDSEGDGQQDPRGEIVLCIPDRCDKPCPPPPSHCPSGVIKNCGCCDVCWIHLREGEICRKFAPDNTMCGPHLKCGSSGACEPQDEQNPEDSDNSSDNSASSDSSE